MFQKNIVKKYIRTHLDPVQTDELYKNYTATFHNPEKIQHIRESKEEQYQEGFLRDLFCHILGYTINPEPNYNLITEKKNEQDSRKADGAIIIDGNVQAVIELKGCDTTDLSKVENQAFGYKAHNPTAHLVVISNFEKLRLYIEDASDFLEFSIFAMSRDSFALLYLCLGMENVRSRIAMKLKQESLSAEISITDKLYADYSSFKRALFQDICELNASATTISTGPATGSAAPATSESQAEEQVRTNKLLLFKKTQKLLDRILFVLFCEDRGLLPENSVARIIDQWQKLKELDAYQPLYKRFQNYFNHIHTGYKSEADPSHAIFAYNGGLFKPDEILDAIRISDDVLYIHTKCLSEYDFESEVSVDILGHIFEHSLTEIEEMQKEIRSEEPGERVGKRKRGGVFYTPAYITKYIVENTIGRLCDAKKAELGIHDEAFAQKRRTKSQKAQLDEKLKAYRRWLLSLKICDPACGSGAFLNAALQFLKAEHTLIDQLNARLYGDSLVFQEVENAILENNLYGVDINEESVEIAKLSLWLHTAQKGRKLSTLNNNIKCGNSLIDDPAVAGEKAFCWEKEFPEVFGDACHADSESPRDSQGFDVVIGNPPYGILIAKELKSFYESKYPLAKYKLNVYILFLERIFQIQQKGIISFIIPQSLLTNSYFEDMRRYILTNSKVHEMYTITEKVFRDAEVGSSLILTYELQENIGLDNPVKLSNAATTADFLLKRNIIESCSTQRALLQNNKVEIVIQSDASNSIRERISKFEPAKNLFTFKNGLNPGNIKGRLITRNASELTQKIIWGKEISRYSIQWGGDYVVYDEHIADTLSLDDVQTKKGMNRQTKIDFSLRDKSLFETEKIVIRKTGDKLIASYDDDNLYFDTLVHGIYKKSGEAEADLLAFLAVLNSKPATYFYRCLHNIKGKAFAKISLEDLANFPIPDLTQQGGNSSLLSSLAHKMLALNADLQKSTQRFLKRVQENLHPAKVSAALENFYTLEFAGFVQELAKQKARLSPKQQDEWEEYFADYKKECQALQAEIAATDNQINQLVYKLYGLTDEEIAVVEGK